MQYIELSGRGLNKMVANFSEIGINFSVFNNVNFPEFSNITNSTTQQFIENIPIQANNVTGGYYGIVVLVTLGIFLIWMLSDITQFGLFRYSTVRALGIALGIMETMGVMMMAVGYMTNFVHLTIIGTLYIIVLVYIIVSNPS